MSTIKTFEVATKFSENGTNFDAFGTLEEAETFRDKQLKSGKKSWLVNDGKLRK